MEFQLGTEYAYEDIEEEYQKSDSLDLTEMGPHLMIGESVIILKDSDNNKVRTFVMSSYNAGAGAYYTLVYDDYNGTTNAAPMLPNPNR